MGSGDGFRVGIGNGVGRGGIDTGRAIGEGEGGGEKHIQWGEQIKWGGIERR